MADRGLLSVNKLYDFKDWLVANGYEIRACLNHYEILRWKGARNKAMPIIFRNSRGYDRHYSCNNAAVPFVRRFIKESRRG